MAISTENLELFAKDKSVEALRLLLESFKEKYEVESGELLNLLEGKHKTGEVPLTAFSTNLLSSLEIIVKYLKEELSKTYHEIAVLLNRDDRTIWSTYNNSLKKLKGRLHNKPCAVFIPLAIFSSRKHSVLESIIIYLKDNLGYSFSRISEILIKDYQTIYTTYKRGKAKDE